MIFDWVLFYLNKRKIVDTVCSEFQRFNFPEPDIRIESAANYLENIISNPKLDIDVRLLAMKMLSLNHLLLSTFKYQAALRSTIILEESIIQYKNVINKQEANDAK